MKKILLVISFIFLINLSGCYAKEEATEVSKLPEIVFMDVTVHLTRDGSQTYAFLDKNGNYFVSKEPYLSTLTFQEIQVEYAAGNLEDKIEYRFSCDVEELQSYHNALRKLDKVQFSLYEPEIGPDVVEDVCCWYGFYYDKNQELKYINLHREDEDGHHDADNEEVNIIYRWYSNLEVE